MKRFITLIIVLPGMTQKGLCVRVYICERERQFDIQLLSVHLCTTTPMLPGIIGRSTWVTWREKGVKSVDVI